MSKRSGVAVYAVDPEQRHKLIAQDVKTRADAQKLVRMAGYIEREIPPDLGPSPWDTSGAMAFHVYVNVMRALTLEERLGLSPTIASGAATPQPRAKAKTVQYKLIPNAFDDPRQVSLDALEDVRAASAAERARRAHR